MATQEEQKCNENSQGTDKKQVGTGTKKKGKDVIDLVTKWEDCNENDAKE